MVSPRARLVRALLLAAAASPAYAAEVTIVYTGETHAMVEPCECVASRDGGVARRATMIERVRRSGLTPTLVLDAGGQFGGSAYDEYTQGPAVDQARTRTHLRACAQMGYAAYAVGDEELQWGVGFLRQARELGGAPFLSANLDDATARAAGVERYTIADLGGLRVGITAATTPDTYALAHPILPDGIVVRDPAPEVERVVAQLRGQVDLVVVLSHLGTDGTARLVQQVAGIDIAINAHYRRPGSLIQRINGTLVCEFNLEARALSRLDLSVNAGRVVEYRLREIPLDASVPDDPAAAALVSEYLSTVDAIEGPRTVLDYYTAWGCPHCTQFEPRLADAIQRFGRDRVILRRWFVCHTDKATGEVLPMFGGAVPDELDEARRQLAIEELAGYDAAQRYAGLRNAQPAAAPGTVMLALGLDPVAVADLAASESVSRILRTHAERTERFRIPGTPTLYLNNLEYDGGFDVPPLLRTLCWALPEPLRGEPCAGVPECVDDSHCRKPGKIGICVDAGTLFARCEYADPTPLELIVLTSDQMRLSSARSLIASLREVFPGLYSRTVSHRDPEGQALALAGAVRWLPAFFLPAAELEERPVFRDLAQAFARVGDYYMVHPDNTPDSGLDISRQREPGRLDLFYRPYDAAALDAVAAFLTAHEQARGAEVDLALRAALYIGDRGELAAEGGVAEIEEAARQAVIWRDFRQAMLPYIRLRREAGNTTYWDLPLRMAGLDPDEVRRRATTDRSVLDGLYADALLLKELGVYGECIVLYENQEVASVAGRDAALAAVDRLGLAASSVTVIYTGNANGQLEACRCPGNPYGGLSRQGGAIREIRELHPNSILVDSGDVLSEQQDWTKLGYLQRALATLQYDAIAVGEQDFAYGVDVFRALAEGSPLRYVSANLELDGLPAETRVIDRGGVRVGLLSLTSPRSFALAADGTPREVTIRDPFEVARTEVPRLREDCAVVVVLFHGPAEDARRLAEEVPGISAVVIGHEGLAMQVPEKVGDTWLLAPGRNGEWVGWLTFRLDEAGSIVDASGQLVPMDDSILDDEQVAAIIAEYQAEVQAATQAALAATPTDPVSEPSACGACHASQLEQWLTTGHARAAQTLRDLDREFDPDCWDCHSAAALAEGAARLPDVSCVACHRVGPAGPEGHELLEPLTEATCLACHDVAKSPHFTMERYWPRVIH